MTTTTDHLATLRKQIADVLDVHHRAEIERPIHDGLGVEVWRIECSCCGQRWPCDASILARQTTVLLDGLEDAEREMSEFAEDPTQSVCAGSVRWSAALLFDAIAAAVQEKEKGA